MNFYKYSIFCLLIFVNSVFAQNAELSLDGMKVKVEGSNGESVKGISPAAIEFRPAGEASLLNANELPEDWEVVRQPGGGVVWSWIPLATGGFVQVSIPSFVLVPKHDNVSTFKISEPVILKKNNQKVLMMNALNDRVKLLNQHEKELEQMVTHLEQLLSSFK